MYSIEIFNHELDLKIEKITFKTKIEANKFVKNNTEKRGYSYFSKQNRSVEYSKLY